MYLCVDASVTNCSNQDCRTCLCAVSRLLHIVTDDQQLQKKGLGSFQFCVQSAMRGGHKSKTYLYCFLCSASNGWITKDDVDETCAWVCGPCQERSRTATEVWPDLIALSVSEAATGVASGTACNPLHYWIQDETPLEDHVQVHYCTRSSNFPESSPLYQVPLQTRQLQAIYETGFHLLEIHDGAFNLDLVQQRLPPHVNDLETGLRAAKDYDWFEGQLSIMDENQWTEGLTVNDMNEDINSSSVITNSGFRWDPQGASKRNQKKNAGRWW